MIERLHVEPGFFAEAEALRAAIDVSFDRPYAEDYAWQVFHVPRLYSYLRARPERLAPAALVERFAERLRGWAAARMGLSPSGPPILHLMMEGHSLSLHSDFHNGAFGWVFSLTRWDQRRFAGGETLLLNDGVPSYKMHQAHGEALYTLVPPRFGQLLVFDDRIVHATETIRGALDPREGRLALVGHLRASAIAVEGALAPPEAREPILALLGRLAGEPRNEVQGTATYRLRVGADGAVISVEPLVQALVTQATGYGPSPLVEAAHTRLDAAVAQLRFPAAAAPSTITFAVLLPVPSLKPIRITAPARPGAAPSLPGTFPLEVSVVADQVVVTGEPPMWPPSLRAQFEDAIAEAL